MLEPGFRTDRREAIFLQIHFVTFSPLRTTLRGILEEIATYKFYLSNHFSSEQVDSMLAEHLDFFQFCIKFGPSLGTSYREQTNGEGQG